MPPVQPDLVTFQARRFGMFVHFGPYSVAGRHEWVKSRERLTDTEYQRYVDHFDPDRFDAAGLARMAREAGCRYVVLTTKHHDGFCLWDSALTDYSTARTIGRDLVAEFVTAVRAEGLGVGLYHSLLDWHHPDFTVDCHHPQREGDLAALNVGRDMARYRAYLHGQVRELLTGYGEIDIVFYDFSYPEGLDGLPGMGPRDWAAEELLALTRKLQPAAVVNDRLGVLADYVTPEQVQPTGPVIASGTPVPWEACHTINGSWGYDRDNLEFKEPTQLLTTLVETVGAGGNLILNVGPNGRGGIDPRDRAVFTGIGEWMADHGHTLYGCGPSPHPVARNCVYTQHGNRLFVHVLSWPMQQLHLPPLAGGAVATFARMVHDGAEVRVDVHSGDRGYTIGDHLAPPPQPAGTVTLTLPPMRPHVRIPVVELVLDRP